ncbi:hypothetical protein LR48_Vigan06g007300 [Vigna angularis]|uniref:Clp R domain-containing protein n=1 Tax=Phaseolus angularis TaxID=3914 RepID=A0A0L9UQ96_PHAAN|nr:hypothetical protein LR48_Vigan06g007300 [Vigna angularis]
MACTHFYHCAASLICRSDTGARLGQILTLESRQSSWLGTELRVSSCSLNLRNHVPVSRRRPLAVTVSVSLPTAKPERASPGQNFPKWSSKAIKSFAMSELEARKLKYPTTGTEALLMGVLIEDLSILREGSGLLDTYIKCMDVIMCLKPYFGQQFENNREQSKHSMQTTTQKHSQHAPIPKHPAGQESSTHPQSKNNIHIAPNQTRNDKLRTEVTQGIIESGSHTAWDLVFPKLSTNLAAKFLRANGISLLKVQDETVKLLGKGDLFFFSPEHPPLTDEAQRALDWAADRKIKSGDDGEMTTAHILLGIWSEAGSPGHKILSTLGFNDEKAGELESLISKPGCTDD